MVVVESASLFKADTAILADLLTPFLGDTRSIIKTSFTWLEKVFSKTGGRLSICHADAALESI